ncbi:MAG: hypothetical protein AABX71_02870 [Nanoarchaeota archaeon]
MVNKKGAEMAVGTLVVIVLAILVLVVVSVGFGTGWTNLWSKTLGYFSPINVDTVSQACMFACSSEAEYDFCTKVRSVTYEDAKEQKQTVKVSCKTWAEGKNSTGKPLPADFSARAESCGSIDCS